MSNTTETAAKTPDEAQFNCLRCGQIMAYLGQLPLRSGGESGFLGALFDKWSALSERVVPLDVYRCSSCGHLEFFDLNFDLSLHES